MLHGPVICSSSLRMGQPAHRGDLEHIGIELHLHLNGRVFPHVEVSKLTHNLETQVVGLHAVLWQERNDAIQISPVPANPAR